MFDIFSAEYGWTSDQIGGVTLRELEWRLDRMRIRTHNKFALHAALYGVKIPLQGEETCKEALTGEEQASIDAALAESIRRKKEELGRGRYHHKDKR